MNNLQYEHMTTADHSRKSILARGCDPILSLQASKTIPPLIGNPEYVPTTTDEEFFEQLQSRQWSIVYFAPGACRFSAAKRPIPGANSQSRGWTLEEYRTLVHEHQGDAIRIVETPYETEALGLLTEALVGARETNGVAEPA
jgi:hypothetical protein